MQTRTRGHHPAKRKNVQEKEGGPRGGAAASLRDLTRGVETAGTKSAVGSLATEQAGPNAGGSAKWLPLWQYGQCGLLNGLSGGDVGLSTPIATILTPETEHNCTSSAGATLPAVACAMAGMSA